MSDIDRADYEVARGDVRSPGFRAWRIARRAPLPRPSVVPRASVELMMENPREPFHFGPLGRHLRVDSCDAAGQKVPRGVVATMRKGRQASPKVGGSAVRGVGGQTPRSASPKAPVGTFGTNEEMPGSSETRTPLARAKSAGDVDGRTLATPPSQCKERHREHHWQPCLFAERPADARHRRRARLSLLRVRREWEPGLDLERRDARPERLRGFRTRRPPGGGADARAH